MSTETMPRASLVAAGGVGLVWAVGGPAAAASVERVPFEFHGTGTVECGTFQDNFIDDFTGTATPFSGAAGEPTRLVLHLTHTSTDSNSVTGLTLHEHGHFTQTIDLVTGTSTLTGNQEVLNRPGYGAIIQDTGRQVYDAEGDLLF